MKPILFNTEMVQAILDGRKTATRRIIKLPKWIIEESNGSYSLATDGTWYPNQEIEKMFNDGYLKPKYKKGEILYVRETWNQLARVDEDGYTHYDELAYVYKSDNIQPDLYDDGMYLNDTHRKWKPSIHMPKKAARLFLRVTDVRVERLQDIRYHEVYLEGIPSAPNCEHCSNSGNCANSANDGDCSQLHSFASLWNSTIKKDEIDQFGWDANPWVFVYEFEVITLCTECANGKVG